MVHEILVAQIALEAVGALESGKFVAHFYVFVVHDAAVVGNVSYPVGLAEGQEELHVARVAVGPVARVQRVRIDVGGVGCGHYSDSASTMKMARVWSSRIGCRGYAMQASAEQAFR